MDFDDHHHNHHHHHQHEEEEEDEEEEEAEDANEAHQHQQPDSAAAKQMLGGGGAAIDAPPVSQAARRPRYRECLKNHAVGLGAHAVDGCGEFLPAGPEGSLDALKCAACSCHRNFHRKEVSDTAAAASSAIVSFSPHHHHQGHQFFPHHHQQQHQHHQQHHQQQFSPYYRTPSGYLQVTPTNQRPLALPSTSGGGGGSHSRGEEMEDMSNPSSFGGGISGSSKKRYRTKFTPDQKDKMLGFAESVGWRIQRQDDEAVDKFCNDTGIKRQVLKVWMHNNKHTLGKKP